MRPLRLRLVGQDFAVNWVNEVGRRLTPDDSGFFTWGFTEIVEQRISIRGIDQGPDQERATLIHEILHALIGLTSQKDRFKPYNGSEKDGDEPVVDALSQVLLSTLRDNPHLVRYLLGESA